MENNTKVLIGITGGIASGKSVVSDWFKRKGYLVIFADKISHELLNNKDLIHHLRFSFGDNILQKNGCVDRRKLADIVFTDKNNLMKLNKIMHPVIIDEINNRITNSPEKIIFLEIPLLFEINIERYFDCIIYIFCPEMIRIKRLMKRNNYTKKEAILRIASQMSDQDKMNRSDIILYNDKDLIYLESQLTDLENKIGDFQGRKVTKIILDDN
ncbi:MAG: dephospho-CoA kinase [Candidatus Cloacimonetes bacterium]|nr:dephospho-CoA kinase [Candidatus Cloacimonadota bacterium]